MEGMTQMERGPVELKSREEWGRGHPAPALIDTASSSQNLKQTGEVVGPELDIGKRAFERPAGAADGGRIDECLVASQEHQREEGSLGLFFAHISNSIGANAPRIEHWIGVGRPRAGRLLARTALRLSVL